MSDDEAVFKGWGWPALSKKAHYIEGGVSLCGKWMFWGSVEEGSGKSSPNDCKTCSRKLAARKVTP